MALVDLAVTECSDMSVVVVRLDDQGLRHLAQATQEWVKMVDTSPWTWRKGRRPTTLT